MPHPDRRPNPISRAAMPPFCKRWVVKHPCRLGEVVDRLDPSGQSLVDGRVFVDKVRDARGERELLPGNVVEVFFASASSTLAPELLGTHDGLLAVCKPAGISTIADQRGHTSSLQAWVAREIGEKRVERVHATSRLDRDVSGVVVFALSSDARAAVNQAREQNRYRRHYIALCNAAPLPVAGIQTAPIARSTKATRRKIADQDGVNARTHYLTISTSGPVTMVAAEPQTGRTHQIRLHLAHMGARIWGDRVYGAGPRLTLPMGVVVRVGQIALHAAWVQITLHRCGGATEPWLVQAPIPEAIEQLWNRAKGEPSCWRKALEPIELAQISETQAPR